MNCRDLNSWKNERGYVAALRGIPIAADNILTRRVHTVVVDCQQSEREDRLRNARGQPELATDEMTAWAAYLREQADAISLQVIDTSTLPSRGVADRLAIIIDRLLAAVT